MPGTAIGCVAPGGEDHPGAGPRRIRAISRTVPQVASRPDTAGIRAASLAVLIDADNASPRIVEGLLAQIATYGVPVVKRIYGDFTNGRMASWKERLLTHSIEPIQQFAYTTGKNATDSALIIDAMDLLYTDRFDGFCIVSSDSDFTRLASRIRQQGRIVYGFGERKTPRPFVAACDEFIYIEAFIPEKAASGSSGSRRGGRSTKVKDKIPTPKPDASSMENEVRPPSVADLGEETVASIRDAIAAFAGDGGWATLGSVINRLARLSPDFTARNYGFTRPKEMFKALDFVELRKGPEDTHTMVRVVPDPTPVVSPAKPKRTRRKPKD